MYLLQLKTNNGIRNKHLFPLGICKYITRYKMNCNTTTTSVLNLIVLFNCIIYFIYHLSMTDNNFALHITIKII